MAFSRRVEIRRSLGIAFDALLRGRNILVEILGRVVASKVIGHRCQNIRLGGAFSVAFCLVLAGEHFVSGGGCAPLPAPVIPRTDARASRDEVVVVDSLHDHAWRPGCQNMSDGWIGKLNKHGIVSFFLLPGFTLDNLCLGAFYKSLHLAPILLRN